MNRSGGWYHDLVEAHVDSLHRHVRLAYPFAGTEQVVRAAFAAARREGQHAVGGAGPAAWLRRAARSVVFAGGDARVLRARNARGAALGLRDVVPIAGGDPDGEYATVIDALERLDDADQELLRLQLIDDATDAQLAFIVDSDPAEVGPRLVRAHEALRVAYGELERARRDGKVNRDD